VNNYDEGILEYKGEKWVVRPATFFASHTKPHQQQNSFRDDLGQTRSKYSAKKFEKLDNLD
jgi:hypothetical protein